MMPLWIVCGYLLLLVGLGVFSARFFRGTSSDFFVASRSIGPFLLLMSLFGTTMTGFALIGSTAESYSAGIGVYALMASWSGLIHSACFFAIGIKLWAVGKRYGYVTQCQYFSDRFDSPAFGYLLFPVLVVLIIPYLLVGLIAAGAAISALTGPIGPRPGYFPELFAETGGAIPKWLSHMVIACVVLIYVFLGGVRSTAWANTFQTIVFMLTGLLTITLIAKALGGVSAASESVAKVMPERLAREGQIGHLQFLTYAFIPLSVGMFPHLFQHWLTARSAKTFRLAVVAHPVFIMIVWVPCVLIGVWATGSGIQFQTPNQVLPKMVSVLVRSDLVTGVLMAGVLAAIMSSLDSQFMCLSTMFSNDIFLRLRGKAKVTDKQLLWVGRWFVIAVVLVTYTLSLVPLPVNVFELGVWCFSGFGSLFPIVFAAVYWKRVTKAGAIAALLTTSLVWASLLCYDLTVYKHASHGEDFLLAGMMPVAALFATCLVTLVVVSLLTSPPSQTTINKFFPNHKELAGKTAAPANP